MTNEVKSKWKRCPDCGLKIRGKNHESGQDHIRRAAERSGKFFKTA
jgi:hypothetical protein